MCHFRESLFFFFFFLSSYRTSGSSLQARVWVPVVRDWMFQRRLLMCYQYVWLHAAVAGAFSLSLFFFFFPFSFFGHNQIFFFETDPASRSGLQ